MKWPKPNNKKELRGFLGICVYYRIWIDGFAFKAAVFYKLLRKGAEWQWTEIHDEAMYVMKHALTHAPALISIDYGPDGGLIILSVDASLWGWGAVLQQQEKGSKKRHPARYESGI